MFPPTRQQLLTFRPSTCVVLIEFVVGDSIDFAFLRNRYFERGGTGCERQECRLDEMHTVSSSNIDLKRRFNVPSFLSSIHFASERSAFSRKPTLVSRLAMA